MVWVTEERKAVGGVGLTEEGVPVPGPTPPEVPVTPTPPPGVGLRPAEIKPVEGFLGRHKEIKAVIDRAGYRYLCTTAAKIAEETGLPEDVVDEHLSVLELDEAGKFLQTKSELDRAFCSIDGVQRLVENLRKLKV